MANPVGVVSGLGGAVAGLVGSSMMNSGANKAKAIMGEGVNYLKEGNTQQRQDFVPYMEAGSDAIGATQNLLAGGVPGQQPKQSAAFDFNVNSDPSAQYRISQANQALEASAVARGATGGGLSKAIGANTQNMAQQAWQSAFDNYLKQNNQDFNQQQTIYGNEADQWKTRLSGNQNLMSNGLSAAGTTGNLNLGFATGVNNNLMEQGKLTYMNAENRAGATAGAVGNMFSGISSLFY